MDQDCDSNISIQELFNFEIDKSIETGDIIFIQNAIKKYKNILNQSYIDFANKIIIQLTEEKIENMTI